MTVDKVLIASLDDPWKGGGVGGKHTHIRLLADGLAKQGVSVEVSSARVTPAFKLLHLYPGAVKRKVLSTSDEKYANWNAQFAAELARNLRRTRAQPRVANPHDVIAASTITSVFPDWITTKAVVLTLHGYFTMEATSDRELHEGSEQHARFKGLEKKAYENATRIVCVDSQTRDYLLDLSQAKATDVVTIPNAVDVDWFRPSDEDRKDALRDELGISKKSLVVLCPRRLVPKNGVSFAVKAMASVLRSTPNAVLVVAGDGPDREAIERLVADMRLSSAVVLARSVPHDRMRGFYSASDMVIVPSVTSAGVEEATSLSMLEGMASGTPVVVTDVGGLKETVRNEVNGLVVPQANPEALAEAIVRLSQDHALYEAIAASALGYVRANHSYMAHAKRVLEEYEKAAAQVG